MYKKIVTLIALSLTFLAHANLKINKNAPAETKQYAPLLGQWSITDSSIDKDGNWIQGPGADWNWYTILDGNAIQDDWIQPPLDIEVEQGKRQYGTNIRIYNPKEKHWEQIWTSISGRKIDRFTAVGKDGTIVMRGFYANNEARITFYNLKENTFDWKMEFQSKTDENIWTEVYRIHGIRKKHD